MMADLKSNMADMNVETKIGNTDFPTQWCLWIEKIITIAMSLPVFEYPL